MIVWVPIYQDIEGNEKADEIEESDPHQMVNKLMIAVIK